MPKGIYAAASAMVTETRLLEATARNVAHAQTPGYRREGVLRVGFAQALADEGVAQSGDIAHGKATGVLPDGSYFTFADGPRDPSGSPYDVALSGDGFFAVQDKQGRTWLTRNGNFQLDAQNRLATRDGQLVLGQGGPIAIPEDAQKVVIDGSGLVTVENHTESGTIRTVVDQLRVATVAAPRRMAAANGTLFDPSGQPLLDSKAEVHQGELERGDVNPVDELVQMVSLQRRYDAAQRAISAQYNAGETFSDILR